MLKDYFKSKGPIDSSEGLDFNNTKHQKAINSIISQLASKDKYLSKVKVKTDHLPIKKLMDKIVTVKPKNEKPYMMYEKLSPKLI